MLPLPTGVADAEPTPFQTPEEPAEWTSIVTAFIERQVSTAKAKGVVVGLSGGVDSAVVAALAARCLGAKSVLGVVMPSATSDPADRKDALLLAKHLDIVTVERPVAPIVAAFDGMMGKVPDHVHANSTSRARMLVLYAEAQTRGMLVAGTGNKSELLTGYFTKHGDGAADLQPLGDLYKTQVWELARWLGLPKRIVDRVPTAGLRPGQTDEGDLGVSYPDLDAILKGIELNQDADAIQQRTRLPMEKVDKVWGMVRRSEHKRRMGLIPKIGARTVGLDWRRAVQWQG